MNMYFVVEGCSTEKQVYPAWLQHELPHFTQVCRPEDVTNNSYYIISGNGYPSILGHIKDAADTIISLHASTNVRYDFLIIALDSEDETVAARLVDIDTALTGSMPMAGVEVVPIVQHCCMETWLLGNRVAIPANPTCGKTCAHKLFYDVRKNDPENMGKPDDFTKTTAKYHCTYLKDALAAQAGGRGVYDKDKAEAVCQRNYWLQLVKRRSDKASHLASFGIFLDFVRRIQAAGIQSGM